ncbi:MAG: hypothetical protein NC926_08005 [Candidatus Omnitrophica bacterium]|nr:hypothetical protein [Candidatus Omnitrophota bacterium]
MENEIKINKISEIKSHLYLNIFKLMENLKDKSIMDCFFDLQNKKIIVDGNNVNKNYINLGKIIIKEDYPMISLICRIIHIDLYNYQKYSKDELKFLLLIHFYNLNYEIDEMIKNGKIVDEKLDEIEKRYGELNFLLNLVVI